MNVRSVGREDIPGLLKLYRHLDAADKKTSVEDALKNWQRLKLYPGSDILIGCLGEDVITTCTLVVIPNLTRGGAPYALIENVVTDAAHRNKGFGKAVLAAATQAAWQAGCYKVMLLTGSVQPSTFEFYHDSGFEQTKTGFQMRRLPPRKS